MRILYINDALAVWGGLERIIVEKVNLLAEMYGYNMYVVTLNQGSHPLPFVLSQKVVYHDLHILFHQQYMYKGIKRLMIRTKLNVLFKNKLREYVNTIQPDIIVSTRAEFLGTILKVKGNIPLVFESHLSRYAQRFGGTNYFHRLQSYFYNRRARHADMVVSLTEGDAFDWYSLTHSVSVIPNVVHLNGNGLYSNCQNKSVIFVGRFSHQKDIGSLIRIWEIVNRRHPDWQLNIYGGYGDEQVFFYERIKQKNINIVVHEPTSDIIQKYKESSMLIMTSRYEPFGLVLPEAMSCGIPVVSFDCPYGPASIITEGKDGFLIADRDINGFADKICLLIDDVSLRQRMGKAAAISSRRFEALKIMPIWKQLFEKLVNERK